MKSKLLVLISLLVLVSSVAALDREPRKSVSQSGFEHLSREYDSDVVFINLISNTQQCGRFCYSSYEITNPYKYVLDLRDLGFEFYTPDLFFTDSVKDVRVDVSGGDYESEGYVHVEDIPERVRYLYPGESRVVGVAGEKEVDANVEWMPTLNLKKKKYKDLPSDEVTLRQTKWALWMKGDTVYTNGLVAFYKLDETTGSTAYSSTTNPQYNGTTTGTPENNNGVFDRAYSFDGVGGDTNHVNICDEPACSWSKSICDNGCSFCAWVNFNNLNGDSNGILGRYDSAGDNKFMWLRNYQSTSGVRFIFSGDGTTTVTASTANILSINTWYHLCGVYNGSNSYEGLQIMYVNGINRAISSTPVQITNGVGGWGDDEDFFIGDVDDSSLPYVPMNGSIDQVSIYNRPLSDVEVLNLYEAGVTSGSVNFPRESSVFSTGDLVPVDVSVGVNSGLLNITYSDMNGSKVVLYDGDVHNQSTLFLDMVNASVWRVWGSEVALVGERNITIDAWGGDSSALRSQWVPVVNFTVNGPQYPYNSSNCRTPWLYCFNYTFEAAPGGVESYDGTHIFFDEVASLDGLDIIYGTYNCSLDGGDIQIPVYNLTNLWWEVHNTTTRGNTAWDGGILKKQGGCGQVGVLFMPNQSFNGGNPTIPTMDATDNSYVTMCVNLTYNNNLPIEDASLVVGGKDLVYVEESDLDVFYYRNWTFLDEFGNDLINFSKHYAKLTVLCDTLGSFDYFLSADLPFGGSLQVQTLELPKFRLYLKTIFNASDPDSYYATEHDREDSTHILADDYMVNNESLMFSFTLIDYTSQCNGLITFSRFLGNDEKIMWLSSFDSERKIYPFLSNKTEYHVRIDCLDGSVRDLGYVKMLSQSPRNIEITNINLGGEDSVYSGGLKIGNITADYASEMIYLPYSKTSGYVSNITFCVWNLSTAPMTSLYCSSVLGVKEGSFSYDTNDRSKNYYVSVFVENDGKTIKNAKTVQFLNESSEAYVDRLCVVCVLPDEVMGVSDTVLYKAIGLLGMLLLGLGFARIDAGYAAVAICGWEFLMDKIGWHDIPDWLSTSAVLLALALLWGMMRRHDE